MQPRVPTRQCQPVFLPWLQPGGLNSGPRVCALAFMPARVRAVVMRPALTPPTFALTFAPPCAPTFAPPCAPAPIRCAPALPATAMHNPAAAARTNIFLHMERLLLFAGANENLFFAGANEE